MRDVDGACARFAERARVRRLERRAERVDAAAVQRFREAQEQDETLLARVRPVLEAHAVPHRFWVCYYSFARRLARLRRRWTAQTLEIETAIAKNIAFARGLDYRITDEIAELGVGEAKDKVTSPKG